MTGLVGDATQPGLGLNPRLVSWLRDYSVVLIVIAMFIVMSFTAPNFFSVRNVMNILDQNAPLMLVALGTTFVIIAGAFDLSSGQVLSLCGVFGAWFAVQLDSAVLGVLLGIAVGVPCGLLNGFLVGKIGVSSFLATLATGLVMAGVALMLTQGTSLDLSSDTAFTWLGSHRFGVIPATVIVIALVFVVLSLLLTTTKIGRNVFAVGSNPEAARLSGISVTRVMIFVFIVGGVSAAIAGLIIATRTGVGNSYAPANTLTLNAIAAVVIGGTSIVGGSGAVWRTVFGVLLLALLQNALNLLDVEPYWQQIVSGLIILFAIVTNTVTARLRA
ncbi:ABC transporter permease [Capillimicrobium parvum]|uniref:Ribose import permease protein RbsC n=1 Tax=Capillimicrobium parvum TaxID=2884022 RepID=A0A9E6XXS0_9ACTN|nr:ABC transporter permease [Capillimicrobium parvum]UGS35736.1 Ribose import permease protein RbsC [Capillimicrobium parvum]